MAVREYDDLQLRIDRDADGSYRVLAMAPDGRTARGSFTPPVTDDELDEFVQRVGLARRRSGSPDARMLAIRDLGATLYDALIKDEVGTVFYSARSAAAERDRGLRITLRLSGSPELMRLPWEFLYKRPRFIAQSTQTPVVRALDVDSAMRPQRLQLPLRVLAMVSSPSGYPELDADAERRNLERALEGPSRAGLVELTWLERATLGELGRRISEPDEVHVLHYIGHGAYDEATESGVLVLETPQGRAHDVSGEDIGAMLQDETSLRLVVLNACEGARTSHVDPFSGVATSLVNFDIPAVIGMQFEITDDAAIAFSESLYTGLARGLAIDAALAPARRAIIGAMMANEFGTPVLFLRDGDAQLFDIADAAVAAPREEGPAATDRSDVSGAGSEILADAVWPGQGSEDGMVDIDSVEYEAVDDQGTDIAPHDSALDELEATPDREPDPHAAERLHEDDPTRRPPEADSVLVTLSADSVSEDPSATSVGGGAGSTLRARLVAARGSVVIFTIVVASAWIALVMLALTAWAATDLWDLDTPQGVFLITQTMAVAVLSIHHLARLERDAAIAAAGYALGLGISLYGLLTMDLREDVFLRQIIFGLLLIVVGAWLTIAGRKRAALFASSSRVPGPFVIANGMACVLSGIVWVTHSWDLWSLVGLVWPLAILGMGVGYAISATLSVKEGRPRIADGPAQPIAPGEELPTKLEPVSQSEPASASEASTAKPEPRLIADSGSRSGGRGSGKRRLIVITAASFGLLGIVITVLIGLSNLGTTGGVNEGSDAASEPSPPVTVIVPAATSWTPTGIDCSPGDVLEITATGTVTDEAAPSTQVTPDGLPDTARRESNLPALPDANALALVGRVGEGQPLFVIGSDFTGICPSHGQLSVGVNDLVTTGNGGSFEVTAAATPQLGVGNSSIESVPGDATWTSFSVSCDPGDRVDFVASGLVALGGSQDRIAGPAGRSGDDPSSNVPGLEGLPHAALIGRIGEGTPFLIGSSSSVTCPSGSAYWVDLALGINDSGADVAYNIGAYTVAIVPVTETDSSAEN